MSENEEKDTKKKPKEERFKSDPSMKDDIMKMLRFPKKKK